MAQKNKPRILIVDDEPDKQARALKTEIGSKANVEVTSPEDLTDKRQIAQADLILVDHRLDDWLARDNAESLCQRPMNGLALSAILRSHADDDQDASPTGIAILSAHLPDLSGGLPPEYREHSIARTNNLEWAFAKRSNPDGILLSQQVVDLASAIRQLPTSWSVENFEETTKQFQSLLFFPQKEVWSARAWTEIEECHPPTHELSNWTHGLAVLRWLLHRILPYPCFLWDSYHLAARLRIQHSALLAILHKKGKLSQTLEKVRYKGVLDRFIGTRWWRSGIEAILWELTSGNSLDADAIRKALISYGNLGLKSSGTDNPIVCVDRNYRPTDSFCTSKESVRLQPDDWPSYADQPWTTIELARKYPSLGAIVVKQDRGRLE
jgi:CheY-like chemotaxis protein